MPRPDYKWCKECGRHASEAGSMSNTRLCEPCGDRLRRENHAAMLSMQGRFALHWRKQMAASVGAVLLDDRQLTA